MVAERKTSGPAMELQGAVVCAETEAQRGQGTGKSQLGSRGEKALMDSSSSSATELQPPHEPLPAQLPVQPALWKALEHQQAQAEAHKDQAQAVSLPAVLAPRTGTAEDLQNQRRCEERGESNTALKPRIRACVPPAKVLQQCVWWGTRRKSWKRGAGDVLQHQG